MAVLTSRIAVVRRMALGAAVLVLVQASIGMVVNLYVTVPGHHSGAQPSNYLSGSFDSVVWAIGHGALALAIHAALGLALVVLVIGVAARTFVVASWRVRAWSVLAGLLVIGAGFNGASFLDFNKNVSSLIMALLALAAVACYAVVLYLLHPAADAGRRMSARLWGALKFRMTRSILHLRSSAFPSGSRLTYGP
jgi:hypothetical protein